jgi:L-alanine-DL-glutamate epimerase-like enolase superfamily enzyme
MPDAGPLAIRSLFALAFRHPLAMPVVTSFGVMRDRPMVLVRAEDGDGVVGWGEAWCNFPSVGAEHRVRIVNEILAPLVVQRTFAGPAEAYDVLTARTEILALQSGEPGPFAQAIAGVDLALWDIAARGRPALVAFSRRPLADDRGICERTQSGCAGPARRGEA